MAKDLVDDARERLGRIDHGASVGDVFPRAMKSHDEVALRPFRTELVRSLIESAVQGLDVDLEDKSLVEQIYELREVPGATAEEGDALALIRCQSSHSTHVPDVVLVEGTSGGLTGFRITLVGKFSVSVDRVKTTSAQFLADRCLARTGDAFDQVVADAH